MDNPRIIHAPMNGRRYAVTSPITQYDYGYLLLPEGVELPTVYEIDFSNDEKHGTSLTVYGGAEGAEVPEELIRTGKDVFAFYYKVGEGYGKTEFTWRIPNHCRPIRDGQTPTPTQQSSIDQLIVRSNEAVETAEQSASDADASAQSASQFAEDARDAEARAAARAATAKNHADRAEQARDDAQTYANNASASATASAQSASQSAQIKADVEDLADDAQGYAQSAEQSAQNAHTYALSANAASGTAENFADVASGYASQAQSSAQTASAKASEASQSATTASQKATESAQSASQALTYKTDAESAKTASQTAQGLAESARDDAISAKNDAESAKADAESARDEAVQAVESISGALDDKADVITDTASGAVASFTDGADGLPLKSLVVSIEPKQDGTGDPSPDNVRPISGWTGCNITQVGKNLYDASQPLLSGYLNSDGTVSGRSSSTNKHTYEIPIKGGATYTYSSLVPYTTSIRWCCTYDSEGTVVGAFGLNKNETSVTFTAPENAVSVSLTIFNTDGQVIQLEVGDSATEKVDYIPETLIPISWQTEAGTVYGGKLDVLSGVLTVDCGKTENPNYTVSTLSDAQRIRIGMLGSKEYGKIICNVFKTLTNNAHTLYGIKAMTSDIAYAYVPLDLTAEEIAEIMSVCEIQYQYRPSYIQTYQLDGHTLNSLYGQNNIFANTGDSEVEYRADTKLYINKKIAEAISALS